MEDDKKDLRNISGDQNAKDNLDTKAKLVVNGAESVVESETRDSAKDERRRVDDMSDTVENLSVFDSRHLKHVLDILKVSSGAQLDELNAQANEYHQTYL